jgi:hypothetical protein
MSFDSINEAYAYHVDRLESYFANPPGTIYYPNATVLGQREAYGVAKT